MNRRTRRTVITFAVLAAVGAGADWGVRWFAEDLAADKIASRVSGSGAVTGIAQAQVSIHGFPFLTQAVTKTLDEVDITLTGIPSPDGVGSSYLTLHRADLTAHGVRIEGTSSAVADTIDGRTTIDYATLGTVLGSQTRTDPESGRILTDSVTIAPVVADGPTGSRVRISSGGHDVIAALSGKDTNLVFTPETEGARPLAVAVPTGRIPLRVIDATAGADGITVRFTGHQVSLG
ncbi:DUF2993 domain-containing protein [Streptomyces sp. CBMA152]|uniref:LmeA family phospholipid-binding protein n=1 Tax=Streptomyces sp. CBMA152 TaxID=1896312 RepID=UPI001660C0F5|nr:DUF2993 domain-containing protein [Streptomyces sp. CBMA152]MBD0741480.1 hypothetical protein [Streptomyces sp. CBMA152]